MRCPDCSRDMMVVTLGTEPPVRLDVCSHCGGVWTDQSEANFFNEADLTAVGVPSLGVQRTKAPINRLCPKDGTVLNRFRGESVPEHVTIYHCDVCGGNWFPQGQLTVFKHAQKAKVSFFKTWHIPIPSAYAILLPIFLILIISGSLILTVRSIQVQQQLELQARSLVGKPVVRTLAPTEIFISFTTQQPVTTSLTYWKTPAEKKTVSVSREPQTLHTIRLSNLSPSATYFYQITLEGASTDISSFTTPGN